MKVKQRISSFPILDDIFDSEVLGVMSAQVKINEVEELIERWREKNFPEHEINDIRVHVQLILRGE